MKKIVFVEKDEGSTYDPVSTFFANKKAQSVTKPNIMNPAQKKVQQKAQQKSIGAPQNQTNKGTNSTNRIAGRPSSVARRQTAKQSIAPQQNNMGSCKKQIENKEKAVTGKIGRKGDYIPPNKKAKEGLNREETIYGANKSKNSQRIDTGLHKVNSFEKKNIPSTISKIQEYSEFPQEEESTRKEHLPSINTKSPHITEPQKLQDSSKLKKRIKQLEQSQKYYLAKLQDLEQKEQKHIKNEQKLTKLQKQSKSSINQVKQLNKRLQEKEEEIKKMMSKEEIPYNKKRQILFINKINQLKKLNRELTLRIKSYKGSDLVEISVNQNKADILNEFQHNGQQLRKDYGNVESLMFRAINQIAGYISQRTNKKNISSQTDWNNQKKLLIQLMETCKKLSLEILQNTESQLKIPSCNEECNNLYNEIEKYRQSMEPIISKQELNFTISEQNIQLINKLHENEGYIQEIKQSLMDKQFGIQSRLRFKKVQQAVDFLKGKMNGLIQVYERNCGWLEMLIAQNLAYNSFISAVFVKNKGELKSVSTQLQCFLKEISDVYQSQNRESLFLYIGENMPQIQENLSKIRQLSKETLIKSTDLDNLK